MMDWLSSQEVARVLIPLLAAIAVTLIVAHTLQSRRVRTVPEGYMLRLKRFGRHSRVVGPGLQTLRPDEMDAGEVLVRRRELILPVSEVFTHGGLPVTVRLSLSHSLDLKSMAVDEIYYPDDERQAQIARLLKGLLQQLVAQTPAPAPAQVDSNRVDMAGLFSPFVGQTRVAFIRRLQVIAKEALGRHGIVLTDDPIVIDGLELPEEIIEAYTDLVQSNFQSSARYDFIRRVRAAAPQVSDAALVQLSSQQTVGDLRTIFTTGNLQPELFMVDRDMLMRNSAPQPKATMTGAPPTPPPPPSPTPGKDSQLTDQHPYAMTSEDMALLKPLPTM